MSTDLIAKLQSQLNSLRSEKARIDLEVTEIEGALKVIQKYASGEVVSAKLDWTKGQKTKQQQIIEAAVDILSKAGPKHTNDLLISLTERGITIGGENAPANLSAYLSREKATFESDRRYGWSLKRQSTEGVGAPSVLSDGESAVDLLT